MMFGRAFSCGLLMFYSSVAVAQTRTTAFARLLADGPLAGLALLDELTMDGYHLLPATRADFLRRLGRHAEAADWYARARDLAPTEAERTYLTRRISESVSVSGGPVRRSGEPRPPEESP